jgi:hypothetical protein
MSLWSFISERILRRDDVGSTRSRLNEAELDRLTDLALSDDEVSIKEATALLEPEDLKILAREVLRIRTADAIDQLRECESCRSLLFSGGYDPIELLEEFRGKIGRRFAQMDIDESGLGGSQRGQGRRTRIRFGPREFLTGTALEGMTVRESQLQVILHELAHAAGDVIPPDGGNSEESVRNQHRITHACLPETYERIRTQESEDRSQEVEGRITKFRY